jgi:hypothetical protein
LVGAFCRVQLDDLVDQSKKSIYNTRKDVCFLAE